ncbi:unnamed protein product [Penicillium olsonii]|uniref:Major facilitator superfamily (MFS) profile domain-containing protein n=1 Tax=Penicillium olsonii TaxID=99116 RepID=A0A9W4H9E2_PENOL|nr:unnamed protein product [Penicillium olsonii]CAG8062687.1 unnamed protein product [Penicillium olsonii]
MADHESEGKSKDLGRTTAIDITSNTNSDATHELHFARRGEALAEASSSQESIDGYDPELMNGRTLLTAAEEKKLLRKIDWRLMTLCSLIFMFKNLDSNNASNARIMNKGTDQNIMTQLGITSNEYNLVTVLYYIPYIVLEAPSNLLLKRFSPSKWQSRIMLSWGIALMCNAAVKNKGGLYTTRFLLGVAEAGQFPGVILQMTYWYRPDEMSLRLLYFYICGNVSGIFGGLLAYAFDTVSGAAGLSGWQWLFLTEGIATVLFSVVIWFLLPDFPETAKWLTEKEKRFIQARLPSNAPRANEKNFKFREIIDALKDIRLWLFTLIWATFTVGTDGVTFYQSTVIADLGYTPWRVQTTSRATGSAFSIGFVNSYGQIGGAIGPQMFRSEYAPRYTVPFAAAMGLVGMCGLLTLVTWWITRETERDTRRLKLAKIAAEKRGETILEDVVDQDLKKH